MGGGGGGSFQNFPEKRKRVQIFPIQSEGLVKVKGQYHLLS